MKPVSCFQKVRHRPQNYLDILSTIVDQRLGPRTLYGLCTHFRKNTALNLAQTKFYVLRALVSPPENCHFFEIQLLVTASMQNCVGNWSPQTPATEPGRSARIFQVDNAIMITIHVEMHVLVYACGMSITVLLILTLRRRENRAALYRARLRTAKSKVFQGT